MHIRPTSMILLSVLILAGLAGCANPASDKPEAAVAEPTEAATASTGGDRYRILPESTIGFVGSKVTGSHEGGFHEFEGEIVVVDGDPTKSNVKIEISTTSLWSDDERLTGHLKSPDFFEVETYPTSTFESTSISRKDEGYEITGNLDLHGVTKSITFPATIEMADGMVTAKAEFFIKRFDFGIVYPGKAENLIRDEVVINFELVAQAEPA